MEGSNIQEVLALVWSWSEFGLLIEVAIFTCGSRSTCCNFLNLLNLLQEKKSGVSMKLQSSVNEFQVQIRSFCEIAIFSQ